MIKYPTDVVRGPNCGITAIACLTHKNVAEVFARFKAKYGRNGNWRGRTATHEVMNLLAEYKVPLENVLEIKKLKERGPRLDVWAGAQNPNHVFLVWTTGHVQVVTNARVYDQTNNGTYIDRYWGRRKFIKRVERLAV